MKALTIKQPWAELIARGHKTMELRTWTTNFHTRFGGNNDLAIHASKGNSSKDVYRIINKHCPGLKIFDWDMEFGAIIAVAKLEHIWRFGNEHTYELYKNKHLCPLEDFEFVPYGWVLSDVITINPVPCKGQLGLWEAYMLIPPMATGSVDGKTRAGGE